MLCPGRSAWLSAGIPPWLIFIAYAFVNSFLAWTGRSLPSRNRGGPALVGLLAVLDGLLVTAIDLVMDPICVKARLWSWTPTGPFFGVPLRNFLGWFVVAAMMESLLPVLSLQGFPSHRGRPSKSVARILAYLRGIWWQFWWKVGRPLVGFGLNAASGSRLPAQPDARRSQGIPAGRAVFERFLARALQYNPIPKIQLFVPPARFLMSFSRHAFPKTPSNSPCLGARGQGDRNP